jgi:hypothetical protein
MGAWSVSLYGNDDSADLRDRFAMLKRLPLDAERVAAHFPEVAAIKAPWAAGLSNFMSYERIHGVGVPVKPTSMADIVAP